MPILLLLLLLFLLFVPIIVGVACRSFAIAVETFFMILNVIITAIVISNVVAGIFFLNITLAIITLPLLFIPAISTLYIKTSREKRLSPQEKDHFILISLIISFILAIPLVFFTVDMAKVLSGIGELFVNLTCAYLTGICNK